jgi:hypothetical protein
LIDFHLMPGASNVRGLLIRELRVAVIITLAMSAFSSIGYREPFHTSLIYTACVAPLIQVLIEAGRYGFAALLSRRSPGSPRSQRPWPGWAVMVPWVIVSGIVGYTLGHKLGDQLSGYRTSPTLIFHDARALLLSVLVPAIGITFFFEARGRIAEMEARTQAAMRAAAENQLKLLESQLEPHMLFNTLANLRVLIGTDPPRAQHMLDRLIEFLRATLEASRQDTYPLSLEFARIGDYLELMQVRMGPRLQYRLDLPPALATLPVPPLLLQPLVENAIRHGLEPKIAGGRLDVAATREAGGLTLRVRDTGVGLGPLPPPANSTSFGTQQVRERLATLYGAAGSLDLANAADGEGGTLAIVRLPVG